MSTMISTAVGAFETIAQFDQVYGKWVAENVGQIISDLMALPEGEVVSLHTYTAEKFGDEYVPVVMGKLTPYLAGPYGPLNMAFETDDGIMVTVGNWQFGKEAVKLKILKCVTENGEEITEDKVRVVFRRNNNS